MTVADIAKGADPPDPLAVSVFPPPHVYAWDFSSGLGPWTSWLPPSVVTEPGGAIERFTRLQAPGALDANHLDGVGGIWLVAHLSTPTLGSPGVLDLKDAVFEMTVRGTDFDANGGKLALWLCRYVPGTDLVENIYVGLQVTNWANTGGDMAGQVTGEWRTITLQVSTNPADWTYAGNNHSAEGEWADRYVPFDLDRTLSQVDATLHLVVLNPDPDRAPSGFLDLANITLRTQTPAVPDPGAVVPEQHYGLEDQPVTGVLAGDGRADATFALVDGSATNGTVSLDGDTGAFTFTAPANYYGPTDTVGPATFRYTVSDGVTTSDPILALVYVGGINDAPVATTRNETAHIAADQPFNFTLFKGADVDGDQLAFKLTPDSAVGGSVSLDGQTGRYIFTPTPAFTGPASFRYRVTDGQVDSAEKTVALTVHAPGQAPTLPPFGEVEQMLISGDLEGWTYWVVRLAEAGNVYAAYHYGTWLDDGINGVTLDRTLARQYLARAENVVPDANIQLAQLYTAGLGGERDYGHARDLLQAIPGEVSAIYRLAILDDLGLGAPVDKARAMEGYIEAARLGSAEAAYTVGRRYQSGEGVAASAPDAYFWLGVGLKFNAPPNYPGFRDLLAFNMNQVAAGLSSLQRMDLDARIAAWDPGEASPVNDAPRLGAAEGSFAQPVRGQAVAGILSAGTDPDGDRLTWRLVAGSTANGTVTIDPGTGAFSFNPDPGFSGPVSFQYVVSDGQTTSAPRTVSFAVQAGTAAAADARVTDEGYPLTAGAAAGLLANDYGDPAAGPVAVTAIDGVAANVGQGVAGDWGVLIAQADGAYAYTPSLAAMAMLEGQTATDVFAYTITDQQGVSASAILTITVNGKAGTVLHGSGVLIGTDLADEIMGGTAYDVLMGRGGADLLFGSDGVADELYGGTGNDTYVITNPGDSIVELAGEGDDTVRTTAALFVLPAHVEALVFTGAGAFKGYGNASANVLSGGAGRDMLVGEAGDDTLIGGAGEANELYGGLGDDTFVIAMAGDTVIEAAGAGFDTVRTALSSYALRARVEALIYTGTGAFAGTGTAEANVITGAAGDDTLAGGGGVDRLNGGAGRDTVTYENAASRVDVRLAVGVALNDGDGASDVFTGIENVIGSAFDDLLVGDGGANVLSGGAGRDVLLGMAGDDRLIGGPGAANQLQGGAGNDVYVVTVADTVVEFAGEGIDTIETTLAAWALGANLENLSWAGTGGFSGTGNALANVIRGGAGDDILRGGGGADRLIGAGGFDIAEFSGQAAAYRIEWLGSGAWRITDRTAGRDGVDLLFDVSSLRFGDGALVALIAPTDALDPLA